MAPAGAHPRLTEGVRSIWRCGDVDGAFPIFSGSGAGLYPGRWNSPASPMIYASESFSTALLEKLAHLNGILPATMHAVEIIVPDGIAIEYFDPHAIPGWIANEALTKTFGDTWFRDRRSALLRVPSIAAAMVEHNVLINPNHADFPRIVPRTPFPVHWDRRLFAKDRT